jgi:predicted ATPase/DNA-binding CsgD family transcriptional regulator
MVATNLLVQLTSFIGRESDLTTVKELITSYRLVTLTGVGGCGKTRLAIQVANSVQKMFADGIWWIDLAPLHEPTQIPQLIAQVLGLRLSTDEPEWETIQREIYRKQLLLILDNCEHLTEACAHLTKELLSHAPELRILTTSRGALGTAGEAIYPLSGLTLPVPGFETEVNRQNGQLVSELMEYDAIHLFVDRARACAPNFRLTTENASAVVEICQRLDGLPLALELAGARVNILTVQEIAERLASGSNNGFVLRLAGPLSGMDPRHHTLHDAIDWSYALLRADEQVLFRRLAIFEAGFTLETAEAICIDEKTSSVQILEGISSLAQKSLVVADTLGRAQARYRLLETVREYAQEKLDEAGEMGTLRDRHLDFFLARAEEAAPRMGDGYQQLWNNWLAGELDNLRGALGWALEARRIEAGLRLMSALVRFLEISSLNREALNWFERLLSQAGAETAPIIRVNACTFASFLSMFMGDAPATMRYGREAVRIADTLLANETSPEAEAARAFALTGLSSGSRAAGDYQTAFTIGIQVLQYYRKAGPPFYLGMGLLSQGDMAIELGKYAEARSLLEESLALAQEAGDLFRIAHSYNTLGDLARYEGKDADALDSYWKGADFMRRLGAQHDLASILCNLGRTYLNLGDLERAQSMLTESLVIQQAEENRPGQIECLIGFAGVAIQGGLPGEGVRLFAACETIGRQQKHAVWPGKRTAYESYLAKARAKLTDSAFLVEQAAGRSMSLDQAAAFAFSLPLKAASISAQTKKPEELSVREREVAARIAQGKTNGEIAEELVLSRRTVEKHAANILAKLDLTSRAQVVRWAIEEGLVQR